eukprot:COSAG05_NODE_1332_length_5154_cov_7.919090_6_plen_92_part_00
MKELKRQKIMAEESQPIRLPGPPTTRRRGTSSKEALQDNGRSRRDFEQRSDGVSPRHGWGVFSRGLLRLLHSPHLKKIKYPMHLLDILVQI